MTECAALRQTCSACPSQWDGETSDGKVVYIRFRWGRLTAMVGNDVVFSETTSDPLDGYLSEDEMRAKLAGVMRFPA
jgi:hypothetical protein